MTTDAHDIALIIPSVMAVCMQEALIKQPGESFGYGWVVCSDDRVITCVESCLEMKVRQRSV